MRIYSYISNLGFGLILIGFIITILSKLTDFHFWGIDKETLEMFYWLGLALWAFGYLMYRSKKSEASKE